MKLRSTPKHRNDASACHYISAKHGKHARIFILQETNKCEAIPGKKSHPHLANGRSRAHVVNALFAAPLLYFYPGNPGSIRLLDLNGCILGFTLLLKVPGLLPNGVSSVNDCI